jgi:signal transduction histidine kinase/CheY-like chemotaxis protein/HPt (histidine-containing phosphotransfer) domain-containing protein
MPIKNPRLMTILVTVFALLLATSMVLFTYNVINQEVRQKIQNLEQQAIVIAGNLAAAGAQSLLERDYASIEQLLMRTIKFPGIDEIQFADLSGRQLSDVVFENGKGVPHYQMATLAVPRAAKVHMDVGSDQLVIWQPVVLGELLGWTKVTYSLAAVQAIKHRIWITNMTFGSILLISTLLLMTLILRRPISTLEKYARFANRLSERHGEQINITSATRELATLGQALNRASGQLLEQDKVIKQGMEDLERLAAFPENSPDIVLSFDSRGAMHYINPAGKQILDWLGVSEEMIHELLPPNYLDLLGSCMGGGRTAREIESSYQGHDFRWLFYPLQNRDLVHCYGSDITERKQAREQATKAMLDKSAAEAASETKNLFIANMSHEIRTPLSAIIGFSEALLDVNQSMAERIENIQIINRAGKHLLNIINDILDLSKIEAGRLEVERVPVNLYELVEDVVTLARLQAESKGIQFMAEPVFPLPETVYSDPVRIRQILLNLIGNAIKFTDYGDVSLHLKYDDISKKLALEVSDTGVGINAEQLSRLFQPFTQADTSTTRRFGGTGLGLALSKQLAEMLGGSISVKSTPGHGSSFTFTLDAGQDVSLIQSYEEWRKSAHQIEQKEKDIQVSGVILVAEDNPDNQRLIALNARLVGAETKIVENGEQAINEAMANTYPLILMDLQMPVMDGLTAIRTLRAKEYSGPIVALTANTLPQDMQRCREAGCNGFLAKPIDRSQFNEILRTYLQNNDAEISRQDQEAIIPSILHEDPGLSNLMEYYVANIIDHHKAMLAALEHDDIRGVQKQISNIKSMRVDHIFPKIAELARQLEFAAATAKIHTVNDLVARMGTIIWKIVQTIPEINHKHAPEHKEPPIISELMQEGPEIAALVPYFLERLPDYLKNLQDAQANGDTAAIRKQAHDLKSVGGGYGYPQVTELAIKLETAAESMPEKISELIEMFSSLARRIEAGANLPAPDAARMAG